MALIDELYSGPERKAALVGLLEQEAHLLASIDRHKLVADEENKDKRIKSFLNKICSTCVFLWCHVTYGLRNWKQPKLRDVMYQSIPAGPSPRRLTPGHWHFFCLGWQIPGGGNSWAVKSPGVGTKKEGKFPVLCQHCNIFHWSQSRITPFKHFNVRFFVSINVFLCNTARILIKTCPSLWF